MKIEVKISDQMKTQTSDLTTALVSFTKVLGEMMQSDCPECSVSLMMEDAEEEKVRHTTKITRVVTIEKL